MIKIRALKPRELKQAMALLADYCERVSDSRHRLRKELQHVYLPLRMLSQLLPPQWQFVPAVYAAASREHVLGLICLSQDGEKHNRWNIDDIVIDPDVSTYDIGTQLVHFVINRYGAGGVQTFLARVFNANEQALGLLKSCGFRHCTRIHYFQHSKPSELMSSASLTNDKNTQNQTNHQGNHANNTQENTRKPLIKGLRLACREDAEKLQMLYSDILPSEVRMSMEKSRADFSMSFWQRLKKRAQGLFTRRWVVEDVARDLLVASLSVSTDNYRDFQLEILVSPGWQEHYEDLLNFGIQHVLSTTKSARITIQAFDFNKEQIKLLESCLFEREAIAEVLVKDYWIPLKEQRDKLRSPLLIFDGGKTSPAVNYQPVPITPKER